MLDFVIGYLKWVMHVVVKLFFILIVGLFLLAVVGLPFGIQANSMFEGASISYMAKKLAQHIPHIGMIAEALLQAFEASSIAPLRIESAIYGEVLFCCIYLSIVRCFEETNKVLSKVFKRFMKVNRITRRLADTTVCLGSYVFAVGIADVLYSGITARIPVHIACWVSVGALLFILIVLWIIRWRSMLACFVDLIAGGVLDVFQLILIYSGIMCITILNTSDLSLTNGEEVALTLLCFSTLLLWVVSFLRRMLAEYTRK